MLKTEKTNFSAFVQISALMGKDWEKNKQTKIDRQKLKGGSVQEEG